MSLKHNKSFGCIMVIASIYCSITQAYENTNNPAMAATKNTANAIAIVNGQYIAKSSLTELEKEIAGHSQGQNFPKEKLIEELISRELQLQDATQKQLDKSPEVLV